MKEEKGKNRGNVPNLRFPGFEGEWESKKLGDISKMTSGGTPSMERSEFWGGSIPFVSAASMHRYYVSETELSITEDGLKKGSRLLPKGNLLLLVRGSALWKRIPICYNDNDVAFNQDVKGIFPNDQSDSLFLLNWFQSNESHLMYLVSGTGIGAGKLDTNDLLNLKIKLPTRREQHKISKFLSLIEVRIETQIKIIRRLETSIQNLRERIFSQKIKFKDWNGLSLSDWTTIKLGDIANRIITKNKENNKNVLTISSQHGLISQLDFFKKSVSAKDLTGYFLLSKNHFAYNKSYSNGYPMGAIKRLTRYDKGVVSTLYICFDFNDNVNLDFMEHYFEAGIQNPELEKIAQEGARNHGLLNIGLTDFFNIKLSIPSLEEQNVIGKFLSKYQRRIEIEKQLLLKYETQKKHLLQNLFI